MGMLEAKPLNGNSQKLLQEEKEKARDCDMRIALQSWTMSMHLLKAGVLVDDRARFAILADVVHIPVGVLLHDHGEREECKV